ncbi:GSCOCG00013010001-RA-CDS, partial [Cotesia congregata]
LWKRLQLTYGLKIKRSTVQHILCKVDPDGVAERSRHRLIRRKYKVATSNNKPEIISYYYLKTIKKLKALPTLIRSDRGTENCLVETLQQSLRYYHDDKLAGLKNFWIAFFKDMRDQNLYQDSNTIHVECLRYCFGPLITAELQIVRQEWNRHRIRKQRNLNMPVGKPNCLFYIPEIIGKRDYKKPIEEDDIDICLNDYSIEPKLYDDDFYNILKLLELHEVVCSTVEDAFKLYFTILDKLEIYSNDT